MAMAQGVGRNLQENIPELGGGVVGVGVPIALRERVDLETGPLVGDPGTIPARLSTPSVAWGLGMGSVTGALWLLEVGPEWVQDFSLAHAATGIPTGIGSALLPKAASDDDGGGGSAQTRLGRSTSPSGAAGEFDAADGASPEAQPSA